jgi:hypothetical protein
VDSLKYNGTVQPFAYMSKSKLFHYIDNMLSAYNQKAFFNKQNGRCIIIEDSPQVTAVAEVVDPQTAWETIRYNHCQMRGDLEGKKSILVYFGRYLDGREKECRKVDNSLFDNIRNVLNNFHIRHNNNDIGSKHYHEIVANMSNDELEQWLDDLYQLILFMVLEIENVNRKSKVAEFSQALKQH